MAIGSCIAALKFQACGIFGTGLTSSNILPLKSANMVMKPLAIEASANQRTENDQKKKCLFYGSTLQKSMRKDLSCTTPEAAKRVGEELIKTCIDLNINEISFTTAMAWLEENECKPSKLPLVSWFLAAIDLL
ncbi:hypothetical protein DH2020_003316 [Rehmannia glutinosa]|uniref:Uncharacterized protein n=1 Tax=Rehmannia glutinosa TaxID=99300 RepID=A0ABR0XLF3_REHGL